MTTEVRAVLDRLQRYAEACGQVAARSPERTDIVDGAHGYIGGALTTLRHLALLTQDEYDEWFARLNGALPPVEWIGG